MLDYKMLREGVKSLSDFDMLQQEFELKKQKQQSDLTGQDPAVVKIANKMAEARRGMQTYAPGTPEHIAAQTMLDDLTIAGKMLDKGVLLPGMSGVPQYNAPQFDIPQGAEAPRSTPMPLPAAFKGLDPVVEESNRAILEQQALTGVNPYQRMELSGARTVPGYGGALGSIAATKKGMETQAQKDVELGMNPKIEEATKFAAERGKVAGERLTSLEEASARVPQLQNLVGRLSHLGQAATYTLSGRARDTFMREMGMEVPDSAVARSEYISMVDNEILPLLRQTFGAQFTAAEGDRLRETLGDANASPAEKDSRLKSFIRTKMEDVNTQARTAGYKEPFPQSDIDAFVGSIGSKSQSAPSNIKEGATATNPQTGERLIYTKGQWRKI